MIETLKPISCGLLIAVAIGLLKPEIKDIKAMILLAFLLLISRKSKKDPLFYILITALIGVVLVFVLNVKGCFALLFKV